MRSTTFWHFSFSARFARPLKGTLWTFLIAFRGFVTLSNLSKFSRAFKRIFELLSYLFWQFHFWKIPSAEKQVPVNLKSSKIKWCFHQGMAKTRAWIPTLKRTRASPIQLHLLIILISTETTSMRRSLANLPPLQTTQLLWKLQTPRKRTQTASGCLIRAKVHTTTRPRPLSKPIWTLLQSKHWKLPQFIVRPLRPPLRLLLETRPLPAHQRTVCNMPTSIIGLLCRILGIEFCPLDLDLCLPPLLMRL